MYISTEGHLLDLYVYIPIKLRCIVTISGFSISDHFLVKDRIYDGFKLTRNGFDYFSATYLIDGKWEYRSNFILLDEHRDNLLTEILN